MNTCYTFIAWFSLGLVGLLLLAVVCWVIYVLGWAGAQPLRVIWKKLVPHFVDQPKPAPVTERPGQQRVKTTSVREGDAWVLD